jgi:aspartate/methionine/tyrosine aminotransferase
VVHYTQEKKIAGVTVDDVYLGNGASELIAMSMNALLDNGDEVLVPAPDYPLWTAVRVAVRRHAGALPLRRRRRLAARPRRHPRKITPQHQGHRGHQPEQPDRRAVPREPAARDRRDRPSSTS